MDSPEEIRSLKEQAKLLSKNGRGYLYSAEGKKLLEKAVALKLDWQEMARMFGRRKKTLENIFSFHKVSKLTEKSDYSEAQLKIAERYFFEISATAKSRAESRKLRLQMRDEINAQRQKEGRKKKGLNAIRLVIQDAHPEWKWAKWIKPAKEEKTEVQISNWWENLSDNRAEEFRAKILEDYRNHEFTNAVLLEKWPEARDAAGLRKAAQALGENRDRLEIKGEVLIIERFEKSLDSRMQELIQSDALNEIGVDGLYEKIKTEFAGDLAVHNYELTKERFKKKVHDLIWTEGPKGTLTALKELVRFGIPNPVEKFKQYHTRISTDLIEAEARELSGTTNIKHPAPFLRGIGRIVEEGFKGEDLNLPETNFDNPYDTGIKSADWNVMFPNGANIGIQHSRVIEENPVRRALAKAERNKDAAVFLTGIIDVDLKKAAGPLKALRALFSGRNINVSILDPSYRQEAQRIIDDLPDDEVVYETAREVFENLMTGWNKISRQPEPNGKPEYSGKVYLVIGPKEEELAVAAAYWEVHYFTVLKRHELSVEIKLVKSALARAEADGENEVAEEYAEKLQELQKQESRTRISNVRVEDWYRFYTKALAFVIRRFEEVIPNCKVIGKGTTYVKIGNSVVEICITEDLRITDKLLSNYVASYGPKVLRRKMADAVVICSPHALNYRVTAREVDAQGNRGSSLICVAPVCIDGEFLRNKLKTIIKKAHPIGKLVFNEQFCPGVLRLSSVNGIINSSPVTIEALGAYERYVSSSAKAKNLPPPKYIWLMVATDHHIGGRPREYIWCEEQRKNLGVAEATFHLLRCQGLCEGAKMPIHIYTSNDDGIHGNHYQTHKQPHPHQLSYSVIEAEWQKLLEEARKSRTLKDVNQKLVRLRDFNLHQFQVRAIDWTKEQLEEVFYRHIEPNIDFFSGVLSRAVKSGLIVRGLSDYTKVPFDSRNLGVINIGTGNHLARTVDGEIVENSIFAHQIRLLLRTTPRWAKERELLEKFVRDPLYSNRFFAWGTIQAPGGYEWGCDFRDTTPAGVDWNDLLRPTVVNDLRRGNYSRIFDNKVTIKTYGDKHFLSMIMTSHAIYLMGPAGTHTDLYGEWGFPPNNTGVVFLGLPAEGPGAGPILLRALLFDHIKDFIENPRPFDWEKFLPNPL